MAEFTFGQMVDSASAHAKDSGSTSDVPVVAGKYRGTIVFTNSKRSSSGKLSIGAKFRIDSEGPSQGGGVWLNQYLSPDSPASLEIWFKTFETLGVPRSHWAQFGADLDAAGADVATRIKGAVADFTVEIDGTFGPKVKYVNAVSGAAPAAPATPAAGVAAPASQAPQRPF